MSKKKGYCIFIDTVSDGPIPVELGTNDNPIVYESEHEAQRVIAEDTIERLIQFLNSERDFEDAMTVEEYVVEVRVMPDGSAIDNNSEIGRSSIIS